MNDPTTPMRTTQKQDTRRRILGAAAAAIRERGLDRPSVGDVMGAAGLTVGGFYAHFATKDALMLEALEAVLRERREYIVRHVPEGPAPERRRNAARGYLSRKHRDLPDECCPVPAILSELPHQGPEFRAALATHFEALVAEMVDSDDAEERRIALADLALMIGALTLARALGPTPFSDEFLSAAKAAIR
jgi:TetR/AcrR family transcriptional repressor of nem operon